MCVITVGQLHKWLCYRHRRDWEGGGQGQIMCMCTRHLVVIDDFWFIYFLLLRTLLNLASQALATKRATATAV